MAKTLNEFKTVLTYLLNNNKTLIDNGLSPVAICAEGAAGIGKTSLIETVANELGMTLCTINLSQLEEVGDLTGFPIKELEIAKRDNNNNIIATKWLLESQTKQLPIQYFATGKTRMSYAPPAWLPTEENPNGTIVFLDDYTRANSLFMQACMELINKGKYISWSLPKYTSIVLSSNPDNGQFNVSSLDDAQKSRFVNFSLKFDVNEWAAWAEGVNIDGRAINFALCNPDIFEIKNNVQIVNARNYTTFCKCISGFKHWNIAEELATILSISSGCFLNDKNNTIGNLFTMFISNKLDRLVQPEEMIKENWNTVSVKIHDCVYDNGIYRPEIASVLTMRLINYISNKFDKTGELSSNVVIDRLNDIVSNEETLFTEDLLFYTIKQLVLKYPKQTGKLLMNPKIRAKIV